jgi:hypothetical protein
MKNLIAVTIPILPGKMNQFNKFINELKTTRFNEFAESRKKLNVRERTFLQKTPMGDFIVVTLEGNDPQSAFQKFGKSNDEFTKWFTAQVKEVHGVDLNSPPPSPELVIDSMEEVYHL